ncbi:hypothetical protein [Puniceibacterium sp. IMCC21224]|uniref:hypothetical protein n=1 Tax=Puniceibacterium sp. IMCC21224 TaxID=1618204 RepID=UPI00064D9FE7|nr:hypothetical protein [Puniceibacterium sp. IMCC21224]KMK63906.1 hypothetical protein IMCC21224_1756 [Puniceibacterium sp. IMCC21224]
MATISAREMASALETSVRKYVEVGILEGESCNAIAPAVAQLRKERTKTAWEYSVSKGEPIRFTECTDKQDGSKFNPLIMVEKICVRTGEEFPYDEWVTVLVLEYKDRTRECPRWHFDLGNDGQSGPRLHMQYGGHYHADRRLDPSFKVPRWSAFPLDTILLLEVVAANFFEEQWKSALRDDRTILKHVKVSEELCYKPLSDKLQHYLTDPAIGRNATFLRSCWNDDWH